VPVAAAPKKGNGALIGIGVAALAAVGVGGYLALAPKPRPAPAEPSVAATTPPVAAAASTTVAPPPAAAPTTPPPAPATFDVTREFDRIVQAAAPGFGVRAQPVKTQLRIGKDDFQFNVQSDRDGYVYVFAYSSDGTLAQLVPNSISGAVKVRKGQNWKFPTGNGFVIESQEPAGATQMVVMVSARQRNHDDLRPKAEGPVRIFPTGEAALALAGQYNGSSSILAGKPVCPATGPCDDEFGAAVMRFESVR
jgi:hypothetical protein